MSELQSDIAEIQELGEKTSERLVKERAAKELANRFLYGAGVIHTQGGMFYLQKVNAWLIVVCYSGIGEVLVKNDWSTITTGSLYVVPPNTVAGYRTVAPNSWGLCWSMYYRLEELSGSALTAPVVLPCETKPYLKAILALYSESEGACDPVALALHVELLHIETLRILSIPQISYSKDRLWDKVRSDLAAPWTLRDLSREGCTNREQLRKQTQEDYARSPVQHVTALRIERAKYLLKTTNLPITKIANQVGYSDAFAFSRAFKQISGRSPAQVRSDLRQDSHQA
jgi:AraC-like DNA-binding protein